MYSVVLLRNLYSFDSDPKYSFSAYVYWLHEYAQKQN